MESDSQSRDRYFVPPSFADRRSILGRLELMLYRGDIEYGRRTVREFLHKVATEWLEEEAKLLSRKRINDEIYLSSTPIAPAFIERIEERFGCITLKSLAGSMSLKSFRALGGIPKSVKRELIRLCDEHGISFAET